MKRRLFILNLFIAIFCLTIFTSCRNNDNTITVCASELPHADVLENCVKGLLKEKGYKLKVSSLDWTIQNESVANKDYDANYFQHIPYLNTFDGKEKLFPVVKVHYEPLGIYIGKSNDDIKNAKSIEICNDTSNAIRALTLLKEKGIIDSIPVNETKDKLTFEGNTYVSSNNVRITLIAEELLVASLDDYDFACLPCNTAITGNVSKDKLVLKEDSEELVLKNANVLAAREKDYKENETYKKKIDALADALLSKEVSDYIINKYQNKITCDNTTQMDLR